MLASVRKRMGSEKNGGIGDVLLVKDERYRGCGPYVFKKQRNFFVEKCSTYFLKIQMY